MSSKVDCINLEDSTNINKEALVHIDDEEDGGGERGEECCYRMESGQDLIDLKQCQTPQFPGSAWCLEVSWEVANKQGGIYTVLRSKAAVSVKEMQDKYVMLGPLTPAHHHEVEPVSLPPCSPLSRLLFLISEAFSGILRFHQNLIVFL